MIKDNIADQLVYSTARIICSNAVETASGTGFFMLYESKSNGNYLALVTNKHVVSGYSTATIKLGCVSKPKSMQVSCVPLAKCAQIWHNIANPNKGVAQYGKTI